MDIPTATTWFSELVSNVGVVVRSLVVSVGSGLGRLMPTTSGSAGGVGTRPLKRSGCAA
jgi:hypothetical protein